MDPHPYPCLPRSKHSLPLLCFLLAALPDLGRADPPYWLCSDAGSYAANSTFHTNLNSILSYMTMNASTSNFYNTSLGNGTDKVYAQHMCLNYITRENCQSCVASATQAVLRLCPGNVTAIVWEEVCQLRYSNQDFIGSLDVSGNIWKDNKLNVSNPDTFKGVVNRTLQNLTRMAAFDRNLGMYLTGETEFKDNCGKKPLYGLVQCGTDLSAGDCNTCLQAAISNILANCSFSIGARLLSRSCYLRYEFYAFYNGATDPQAEQCPSAGIGRKVLLILILTGSLAALVLFLLGSFLYYLRKYDRDGKEKYMIQLGMTGARKASYRYSKGRNGQDNPFIDLRTILAATNKFSSSNKLGQGGFGPVYKGVFSDGREVAVKMLESCSEQGTEEFTNEVLLIMKLQHKNLVKLLGFCVDKEEKMLVYEFMPNSSLDVFLFDRRRREKLDWVQRLNIINGIARGVLYLHEESRLRIIHRDLKPSNVLLDSDMNPKISDFGMARIFAGNDAGANTATIVGTYGYMAPEYAMEGLYSTKSDVFSFGVILLEMITGERNADFHKSGRAPSLQAYAWQLWNEGREAELVDPLLRNDSSLCQEEFRRYMNVGLLCVQEDAHDRPLMSSVVVMLKSEATGLRNPERPAFSVGRFTDHREMIDKSCSINGVTVSDVHPR